jgi:hypothetical protein
MKLAAAFALGILVALYAIHRALGGRDAPAVVPRWVFEEEALPPADPYLIRMGLPQPWGRWN